MDNGIFISQSRHESNPSRQVGAWNKYFDAVSQTDLTRVYFRLWQGVRLIHVKTTQFQKYPDSCGLGLRL